MCRQFQASMRLCAQEWSFYMRKLKWYLCICIVLLAAVSCAKNEFSANTNTVYLKKDGTVTEASFDLFDKEYYSSSELEAFVEDEVNAYNSAKHISDAIKVRKVEVANQVAAVFLEYQSWKDYKEFNQQEMFLGTIEEALNAGYAFDTDFLSFSDYEPAKLIDALGNNKNQVFIWNQSMDVQMDGSILYLSKNVEKKDKKSVTLKQGELSYIIYK